MTNVKKLLIISLACQCVALVCQLIALYFRLKGN